MRKHEGCSNEKSTAKCEPLPSRWVKRLIHSFYLRYLTVEANARKKFTQVTKNHLSLRISHETKKI